MVQSYLTNLCTFFWNLIHKPWINPLFSTKQASIIVQMCCFILLLYKIHVFPSSMSNTVTQQITTLYVLTLWTHWSSRHMLNTVGVLLYFTSCSLIYQVPSFTHLCTEAKMPARVNKNIFFKLKNLKPEIKCL